MASTESSKDVLKGMSVKDIKALLVDKNINFNGCFEKSELIDLLMVFTVVA